MKQSDIIYDVYNSIDLRVKETKYADVDVSVLVKDICQSMLDRSGQRIIHDEKMYEPPAMYEICIAIRIEGKDIKQVLQTYGEIAVLFKDNPQIDISSYAWHNCSSSLIYLEPVIRKTDINKESFVNGIHQLELLYKTEFSINSQKTYEFKRVEKREIHSVNIS